MVGERKELTADTKTAVVSLFQSGFRQTEISRRLGIPRTTIAGIINRFRARNSVENLPRKGAPTQINERESRALLRIVKQNRKRTLSDIT